MGLFDDITCEKELPGLTEKLSFQTKDLDCMMGSYTITAEGRLIEHAFGLESRTPEEKAVSLIPLFNRVELGDVDTNYHGWLNFYGDDSKGQWHEFNAKFTDGVMVEVVRVESK
jgi:hypothetical protein